MLRLLFTLNYIFIEKHSLSWNTTWYAKKQQCEVVGLYDSLDGCCLDARLDGLHDSEPPKCLKHFCIEKLDCYDRSQDWKKVTLLLFYMAIQCGLVTRAAPRGCLPRCELMSREGAQLALASANPPTRHIRDFSNIIQDKKNMKKKNTIGPAGQRESLDIGAGGAAS